MYCLIRDYGADQYPKKAIRFSPFMTHLVLERVIQRFCIEPLLDLNWICRAFSLITLNEESPITCKSKLLLTRKDDLQLLH